LVLERPGNTKPAAQRQPHYPISMKKELIQSTTPIIYSSRILFRIKSIFDASVLQALPINHVTLIDPNTRGNSTQAFGHPLGHLTFAD
jgi:hypothetical protein